MQVENKYDYIIAGAGCAGYSLLYHLLQDPILSKKKILVLDANFNKGNDRTWCFWEDQAGPFESIVCKKWSNIEVLKGSMHRSLPTAPFEYKMIQGIDFYQYVSDFAKGFDNVEWVASKILSIDSINANSARVNWVGGSANAGYVFSSINGERIQSKLWQHFKGIVVEFDNPVFDDTVARLMDFNVPQMDATAFMYLLPLTDKKALVEYTLFTEEVLDKKQYQDALKNYIANHLHITDYNITEREFGVIPMTNYQFKRQDNHIHFIGTAGGATKASSGYTFTFIQQQTNQIITQINFLGPH